MSYALYCEFLFIIKRKYHILNSCIYNAMQVCEIDTLMFIVYFVLLLYFMKFLKVYLNCTYMYLFLYNFILILCTIFAILL